MTFLDIHIAKRTAFEIEKGYQPFSSIFYIIDGSFEIKINDMWQTAKKGDVIYLPKNLYFERRITETLSFYYIRFFNDEEYYASGGFLNVKNLSYFEATLQYLIQEINSSNKMNKAKSILLESIFCQNLIEKTYKKTVDKNLQKCVDYIAANVSENIDLERLCALSGYSKTVFIDKFKCHYGMTPIVFLIKTRIAAAKDLLLDFELSIGEVAEKCGFNCPYYFSNTFKRHCGESPLQYRKKHSV